MAGKFDVSVDTRNAIQSLRRFKKSVVTAAIKRGLTKSAQVTKKKMKPIVRVATKKSPWSTGWLAKNIIIKVGKKSRADGTRNAVIGGANKKSPEGRNPQKYFHLVDEGVKRHSYGPKTKQYLRWRGANGKWRRATYVNHPGLTARQWRKSTVAAAGNDIPKAFNDAIQDAINKALAKGSF